MKAGNISIVVVEPDEGNLLTQVKVEEGKPQMFWSKLYLGKNDSLSNYKEISKTEAEKIIKAQEEALKEKEKEDK